MLVVTVAKVCDVIVPVAPQQARCALQGGRNDHEHGESHEAQNRPGAREAESVGKLPEVCVHEDEEYRYHEHGSTFAIMGGREASWWMACLSDQPSIVSTSRKMAR